MKLKKRKEKFSLDKHAFLEQPCSLCSRENRIDTTTTLHFCDRCTLQLVSRYSTMTMLVKEIGECKSCGSETHQLVRSLSAAKDKITEQFICNGCHHVVEVLDKSHMPKSNRPAGWRFMKQFVDAEGTVYQLKEFTGEDGKTYKESVDCPELKGTLPPTDVDAVKAGQKEKRKAKKKKKEERMAKKQAKLAKEYKKKEKKKKKEESKKIEEQRKEKFFEE